MRMRKKQFKFVYSEVKDECPSAVYFRANNITNAKTKWEEWNKNDNTLLAIFCENEEVWRNNFVKTGYQLDII